MPEVVQEEEEEEGPAAATMMSNSKKDSQCGAGGLKLGIVSSNGSQNESTRGVSNFHQSEGIQQLVVRDHTLAQTLQPSRTKADRERVKALPAVSESRKSIESGQGVIEATIAFKT